MTRSLAVPRPALVLSVALASALGALSADAALAQEAPLPQADRPLPTLSPAEIAAIEPLLATGGVVCLVEFAYGEDLPAIVIVAEANAPADELARVIGDPSAYPTFMPALDAVTITSTEGSQVSYAWTWQTSIFTLRGENAMQAFAPPAAHPEAGHRFVVRSTSGDLGAGRTVWRVVPRGADRALVMSSSRMDLRDANYIARELAAASSSVNRSINLALAFSMLVRARAEAERRVGHARTAIPSVVGDPELPQADWLGPMEAMLERGDLLWVETTSGSDQGRVIAMGRMPAEEARVRAAILDPGGFTQGLLQGAHATILEQSGSTTRFSWGIDLPLVGTDGEMRIREGADRDIRMEGTGGALDTARWRFRTIPMGYGTLLIAAGRFDLADGLWLVRVVQDADPSFRPGLSAAAQLMMVRGLRTRLIRGL